jgi:hypothetical protein
VIAQAYPAALRKAALEAFEGQYTIKQLDEKSESGNDSRKGIKANFRYKTISCIKHQQFLKRIPDVKMEWAKKKPRRIKRQSYFILTLQKKA